MIPVKTKHLLIAAAVLSILAIAFGALFWVGNDTDLDPSAIDTDRTADNTGRFTFFNIGPETRLTKQARSNLGAKLGADAIERKGIIDLKPTPPCLIDHFASLFSLHRRLNSDVGARVEHNITRLTYRYPGQKGRTPFKFVELVFSNEGGRPLYFKLTLKKEGTEILKTLGEKYGNPKTIAGARGDAAVFYWEKNRDRLIVSKVKDRLGNDEYHVMFYFVSNLERLIKIEEKERELRERELQKAGKTAF